MIFLRVHPGSFVRLDCVREITPGPTEDQVTVCLTDGGERWASTEDWEAARRESGMSTFPANPGTFYLWPCFFDEYGVHVIREAVIAWSAQPDGQVRPIIFSMRGDRASDDGAIEFADGTVESRDGTYQSSAAWIAELRTCQTADEQARKSAPKPH